MHEIEKMGRKCVDSNQLFIDNLRIPVEDRIGEEGKGFSYILHGLNPERILIAAEVVGLAYRAAQGRRATPGSARSLIGPIGKNQGVQHPLARSWMELEAAHLMVQKAAWLYDQQQPCGAEANSAKFLGAEACYAACENATSSPTAGWGTRRSTTWSAICARRGYAPGARESADDPQLHRREGARAAQVLLRPARAPARTPVRSRRFSCRRCAAAAPFRPGSGRLASASA